MPSAATAAWPSANTPAFGVPTLVTSPTAYTPGNCVSSVIGFDRDPAVDGHARLRDHLRHPVRRHAEEEVVGHLAAVAEHRDAGAPGRARAPASAGCQSMPRSANAASSAFDASGDGGMGTGNGMTSEMLRPVAQPAVGEEVVHQERGLARRGRALERRRRHRDDHAPAVEVGQHVAQRERAGFGVELVTALDEPRRRLGMQIGAERDDEHIRVERARVGFDALCRRDRSSGSSTARTARPA